MLTKNSIKQLDKILDWLMVAAKYNFKEGLLEQDAVPLSAIENKLKRAKQILSIGIRKEEIKNDKRKT